MYVCIGADIERKRGEKMDGYKKGRKGRKVLNYKNNK